MPHPDGEAPRFEPALSATSDKPLFAQPAAETEGVDNVQDASEDTPTSEAQSPDGEATDSPKESGEGDKTPAWQKARVTREENLRKAAEARAFQAETERAQLAEALAKLTTKEPEFPVDDPRPTRDMFDDPDSHEMALIEWTARQTEARVRTQVREEVATETAQAKAKETQQAFEARRDAFVAEHPDFEQVVTADGVHATEIMLAAIVEAEDGPAIAYHLGKNPELSADIAKMSPLRQVQALGRISAELAAPPSRRATKPDPITPLRSRNSANPPAREDMSMEEYARARNAELLAARTPFIQPRR
jgi:hypothetical protein